MPAPQSAARRSREGRRTARRPVIARAASSIAASMPADLSIVHPRTPTPRAAASPGAALRTHATSPCPPAPSTSPPPRRRRTRPTARAAARRAASATARRSPPSPAAPDRDARNASSGPGPPTATRPASASGARRANQRLSDRRRLMRPVPGDAQQPGPERRVAAEGAEVLPRPDQRILRRFLGLLPDAQRRERGAKHRRLMTDDELVEGADVPRPGEPHQLVVRHTACRPRAIADGWVPVQEKGRRDAPALRLSPPARTRLGERRRREPYCRPRPRPRPLSGEACWREAVGNGEQGIGERLARDVGELGHHLAARHRASRGAPARH